MNAETAVSLRHHLTIKQGSWLVLGLLALAIVFTPLPVGTAVPTSHTLHLTASSFAFSPAVIKVNPGDQVTIDLTSTDVVHGLYLDGYDLEMTADPGQTATLTFTADKTGTFRFRCSVTCGALHPFMIGKLKVGPNTLLWRGIALSILAALLGLWKVRQ
jgi:heme/copper-type cytochrome/quinol oxidase subunit 2